VTSIVQTDFGSLPSSIVDLRSPSEPSTCLCEWEDCNQCFTSTDDLNSHILEKHVGHGKSTYECSWKGCDRNGGNAFPSKQKVMRHIQVRIVVSCSGIILTMMQKHSGFKPHICNVCQEKFAETTSLQQHMRRHTQESECAYNIFMRRNAQTFHRAVCMRLSWVWKGVLDSWRFKDPQEGSFRREAFQMCRTWMRKGIL